MTLIDQIRDLIAEGETQRSLDELYKYVKESNADVIDHLVMLRSRMQNLQRAVSNGTMDEQDAAMERAKINEAILKLLPQLTPEYLAEASKRREVPRTAAAPRAEVPSASAQNNKMIYMIGGGLLVLALLILAVRGCGDGSEEDSLEQVATDTTLTNDPQGAVSAAKPGKQKSAQQYNNSPTKGGQEQQYEQQQVQTAPMETQSDEWQSNDGRVAFSSQDGTNWAEMENGEVKFKFKMTAETSEYVEIYDASRQMTLRIFENNVKFQQEGEWHVLAYGGWK